LQKRGVHIAKTVEHTGPCTWLVERPHPGLSDPTGEWYPDSPSDMTVTEECGAMARYYTDGSFECDNGHSMGSMEEELGPYGNEWQREQEDRMQYGGSKTAASYEIVPGMSPGSFAVAWPTNPGGRLRLGGGQRGLAGHQAAAWFRCRAGLGEHRLGDARVAVGAVAGIRVRLGLAASEASIPASTVEEAYRSGGGGLNVGDTFDGWTVTDVGEHDPVLRPGRLHHIDPAPVVGGGGELLDSAPDSVRENWTASARWPWSRPLSLRCVPRRLPTTTPAGCVPTASCSRER
jgi:hypothetical protein